MGPPVLDRPATGCRLRAKPKARRYEHEAPGDLVHSDAKKLGASPTVVVTGSPGRAKGARSGAVTQAGGVLLTRAAEVTSLTA